MTCTNCKGACPAPQACELPIQFAESEPDYGFRAYVIGAILLALIVFSVWAYHTWPLAFDLAR
jgi:hypothetical protein